MATYGSWQATIQNETGDIIPGAEIEVILESSGLAATIYSGRTGGALANPFFADANGFAQFYADSDEYRVIATDGGSGFTNTWRYEEVGSILSTEETAARVQGRNVLINANLNTPIVNQRGFAGGQPAAGVYGYDRWKGDALGTRIEQVVENTEVINEDYVISWVGGTGTADVDGVTGLSSGDTFTLNTSANYSVIIPTDATYIMLEAGSIATTFEHRAASEVLSSCQNYYYSSALVYIATVIRGSDFKNRALNVQFPVTMRADPLVTLTATNFTSEVVTPKVDGIQASWVSSGDTVIVQISDITADSEL